MKVMKAGGGEQRGWRRKWVGSEGGVAMGSEVAVRRRNQGWDDAT